tara:strand:- start:3449 stop:3799 length:351 start_codon:yes stop_codon:yes gene_type:complete
MEKSTESVIKQCEKEFPVMSSEFKDCLAEMYRVFMYKQSDYGPGNIAMGTQLATDEEVRMSLMALIVRMNDKINRLINLVIKKNEKPQNESVMDSFMDLANYAVIAKIVSEGKWGK